MQAALAQFIVECPGHALELATFYQGKRDRFLDLLAGTPLRPIPTAVTYFQLADYSAVSRQHDVEFARVLAREIGVAAIPVSVFSDGGPPEQLVRFCFAKSDGQTGKIYTHHQSQSGLARFPLEWRPCQKV